MFFFRFDPGASRDRPEPEKNTLDIRMIFVALASVFVYNIIIEAKSYG